MSQRKSVELFLFPHIQSHLDDFHFLQEICFNVSIKSINLMLNLNHPAGLPNEKGYFNLILFFIYHNNKLPIPHELSMLQPNIIFFFLK